MIAIDIAAGVALILFGIRFLRKALDRLFGHGVVEWLQRMTRNRFKAFGSGVAVAMVAPSSTTISLLTMQMLAAGKLTAERMLAVSLGAGVGITVTVLLLSLRVSEYRSVFLLLGIAAFLLSKRQVLRGIGQFLFALGLLFVAMDMIGTAARTVSGDGDLQTLSLLLEGHPLLVVIFGATIAVLLQSSTATIGIAIGLATGGVFDLAVLIPLVLGANLGIAGTGLIAGWSQLEGRRLAAAYLTIKAAGAVMVLVFLGPVGQFAASTSPDLARQAANLHSAYNLAIALVALPLITPITLLFRILLPAPEPGADGAALPLSRPASYLDPRFLDAPSLALGQATREVLLMMDLVGQMLRGWHQAYLQRDANLVVQVQLQDDHLDRVNAGLKVFLSQLGGDSLGVRETQMQLNLLVFADELEAAGDLVDKHLCDHLVKHLRKGCDLPGKDQADLREVFQKIQDRLQVAATILTTGDGRLAGEFLAEKEGFDRHCRAVQRDHFSRLRCGDNDLLESSAFFLDVLAALRKINSHLTCIGRAFASEPGRIPQREAELEEPRAEGRGCDREALPASGCVERVSWEDAPTRR